MEKSYVSNTNFNLKIQKRPMTSRSNVSISTNPTKIK